MTLVCSSLRTLGNFLLIFDCRWWQARKIAIPSSLPISRCFASISVIDVILIWQGLWSPVALDNYIEKPNPLLKTGNDSRWCLWDPSLRRTECCHPVSRRQFLWRTVRVLPLPTGRSRWHQDQHFWVSDEQTCCQGGDYRDGRDDRVYIVHGRILWSFRWPTRAAAVCCLSDRGPADRLVQLAHALMKLHFRLVH